MDGNIISFAEKTGDATAWTSVQVVEHALERLKTGDCKEVKKVFVLYLDDEDGKFNTAYNQSGMKASELLALLEVTKANIMELIRE